MFSKACEYGIRATLMVATHSLEGKRVNIKDIARETDSPLAFTGKILQQLVKGGIVRSVQGVYGGFEISRAQMEQIPLSAIVSAIDGDQIFTGCGLGLPNCNELQPCPMHERFAAVRQELKTMLDETTVLQLALGLKQGLTFLKR